MDTNAPSLGTYYDDFVEAQIASGRFASTDEVVRAGLRLLEERERKLQALRAALAEGEASGEPQPFDRDAFLAEMRRKHHAQHG